MSLAPIQPQVIPIPKDLRNELFDYWTPWKISDPIFNEMKAQSNAPYKKVQVLPNHREWRFVWNYFHHRKSNRYGIKNIYCIHERHQQQAFENNLSSIEREAGTFKPSWDQEPRAAQRAQVIEKWKKETNVFSPFATIEPDGRRRNWKETRILPLWHGSSQSGCNRIANSGFTYFGKKTDHGFFGSGIYFSDDPRYVADIYSEGHMLLSWVSMREPFPVVGDPTQADMKILQGKGAYKDYNAHYIPVTSVNPADPYEAYYYPTQDGEASHCNEIVVFQKSQTLPRFWVELQVEVPYLMTPSEIPQFVEDLIPHFLKLLQNPAIDKDKKLRNYLGNELGFLLKLQGDDYLEDKHEKLYEQMTQLLDTNGKVVKLVSLALMGISSSSVNSLPSTASHPTLHQSISPTASSSTPQPVSHLTSTTASMPSTSSSKKAKSTTHTTHKASSQSTLPQTISSIASSSASSSTTSSSILNMAFDKDKWAKYFGDIGVEPPLPANIEEILNGPCPFWEGQKIHQTHLLTLIPGKINNTPLTLDTLQEFIVQPKAGYRTKYRYYGNSFSRSCGIDLFPPQFARATTHSHWALVTRDVIPNSHGKIYPKQKDFIATYSSLGYQVPNVLDVAVSILMEYVQTGNRLYGNSMTLCQENLGATSLAVVDVGNFNDEGIVIGTTRNDQASNFGMAALRRL